MSKSTVFGTFLVIFEIGGGNLAKKGRKWRGGCSNLPVTKWKKSLL